MKVIVDDKIPYIKGVIEQMVDEVIYLPGKEITHKECKDADALLIRTRTKCNQELLAGSRVKFIGTATIGVDHIDINYCKKEGIIVKNAPGCNAESVAQYIESVLCLIKTIKKCNYSAITLGIVGLGHVGTAVYYAAKNLGITSLLCDPFKLEKEEYIENNPYVSLEEIGEQCNVITFHTPLTYEGRYPTFHMVNNLFLSELKQKPILINSSRGEVFDTSSLIKAYEEGVIGSLVLDVWENEPVINPKLLSASWIGTPHIAGYSADGKANATKMILNSFANYLNIPFSEEILPPTPLNNKVTGKTYEEVILKIYNPITDSNQLKKNPLDFESIRGNYPLRREKSAYFITYL